jgi:hypothetical protein
MGLMDLFGVWHEIASVPGVALEDSLDPRQRTFSPSGWQAGSSSDRIEAQRDVP